MPICIDCGLEHGRIKLIAKDLYSSQDLRTCLEEMGKRLMKLEVQMKVANKYIKRLEELTRPIHRIK